jgi:signal transduction histidine kinase
VRHQLASLGQLTAGIAHEIKNPLNFVNNFSGVSTELIDELREALGRMTGDDKTRREIAELADTLRDNLDKIVQHGKRADAIVKNMLLHSREGSGEHRAVNVNALVEESLNLAYHGARAEKQGFKINMERSFDPAADEVDVFPQEITIQPAFDYYSVSYLKERATRVRNAVTFPLSTFISILVTSATRRSRSEPAAVSTALIPASSHDVSLTPTTSITR